MGPKIFTGDTSRDTLGPKDVIKIKHKGGLKRPVETIVETHEGEHREKPKRKESPMVNEGFLHSNTTASTGGSECNKD